MQVESSVLSLSSHFVPQGVPATVDGMLGGFGQLSNTDAASSRKFIQPFMKVNFKMC